MQEGTQTGVVTYFCKSRGHGFIQPSDYQVSSFTLFVKIQIQIEKQIQIQKQIQPSDYQVASFTL